MRCHSTLSSGSKYYKRLFIPQTSTFAKEFQATVFFFHSTQRSEHLFCGADWIETASVSIRDSFLLDTILFNVNALCHCMLHSPLLSDFSFSCSAEFVILGINVGTCCGFCMFPSTSFASMPIIVFNIIR